MPDRDAGVFDSVMPVHVEVALCFHREIEQPVAGERLQHVIEESDPGLHRGLTPAVEDDPNEEIGLLGGAPNLSHSWRHRSPASVAKVSPRAASTASMSSSVPIEIRRHSERSVPPETSRTRMPYLS